MAPRCARVLAALAINLLLAGGPHPAAGEELVQVRTPRAAGSPIEWRSAERELIERGPSPVAKSLGSSGDRTKLAIDRDGVYRISGAQLAAAGADLANLPLSDVRVMSRGRSASVHEVAIRIHDENLDGIFDTEDWFELWGEALTGEEHTGLFQQADYSDVNAYFVDALPGARLRMLARDGAPRPGDPAVTEFLATARLERDDVFLANHRTGQFDVDHFYSCPSLVTGGPSDTRTESIPLPGLVRASSLRASLRARLLSRTNDLTADPDHLSELRVGATLVSQRTADGYAVVDHEATGVDPMLLADPASVSVRLPGIIAGVERSELDFIEIDYPREFSVVDDRLDFRIAGPARVTITGLSAPDVSVLDVTDPDAPELLTGLVVAPGSVSLGIAGGGMRHVAVAAHPAGAPTFVPRSIAWVPDTGLRDPANRADLVVIGPDAWLDPPRPAVQRYVDWREAQGVRVRLVPTSALFDEMNDGLFSPFAVSRLLETALSAWALPPRWCLLLGDASLDHRDVLGGHVRLPGDCSELPDPCGHHETGWVQHVPTYIVDAPEDQTYLGYFASDSILAMVAGADWMPDVALGRLPARDAAQLDAMLDKIVAYEQLAAAPPPWASRYLTIADEVAPGQQIIEQSQDDAATLVPDCYDRARLYYQRDYGAANPAGFTADLLSTWSDPATGGAIASYVGHGNTFTWSSDALLTNDGASCRDDVAALTVAGPEPFVVNADCIAGGFMHLVGPSLLEELVRAPQGGAIAAFGPTGITDLSFARTIVMGFYDAIYGPNGRGRTLGDALLAVQEPLAASAGAGAPNEILSNVLLGDPSMRLVIPFGPAAISLAATASAGRVALTWDAVPGADAYRLYRSSVGPDGPWTILVTTSATSALDQAVTNATLYHYALEPLAGCLPGRWSDVVAARPCDAALVPASPSGFQVVSAACNGDVLLAWQASPSADVAYDVRAFASSADLGLPPERENVVAGTVMLMRGLVPFRWYDIEVSALDGCGARSPAQRVRVRPSCPLVMDAPAFITDLRMRRRGSDLVMSWGPVTRTIQGLAFTPADYAVFRSTRPDFAAAASLVDRVTPAQALQAGRVGNGSRLEFFAVAAEDGAGLAGPVGHDLPQGVLGLARVDLDATRFQLSWYPVRYDIRGDETPILDYEIYASTSGPLARADVESMAPVAIVAAPPAIVDRALGDWHFVVAVDVHGNRSAY